MKLNYFNFRKFNDKILMTNDMGKFIFVSENEFKSIISKNIDKDGDLAVRLKSVDMIYDKGDIEYSLEKKYNIRELKTHLNLTTSLHIFVVTTMCNMGCVYCQANNGLKNSNMVMDYDIAEKSVDIALDSPEKNLSFEFQGGEPLLNFDIIRHIIEYSQEKKGSHDIEYSVVTNLTLLSDEMIELFKEYNVNVSTSIDGSEIIHNYNRKYKDGTGTYKKVVSSVERLRKKGVNVGAIETTTRNSLQHPEDIVKTYVELGFDSIFIRPLTQLGKATKNWLEIGYTAEEFIEFYKRAIDELIKINLSGKYIKEEHCSILLRRIYGRFINYMELRSPCGAGIGQLAYYPDGNIFTCDEGRMFYEMGQDTFCLGNVFKSNHKNMMKKNECKAVCAASILEAIPNCCDCVYQPYCGTCPVINYALTKDIIEKHPRGYRCKIYSGMLDFLFSKFYNNEEKVIEVLSSWGN